MVKNPPANAYVTDVGSILGSGRCPTGGHGNPLQCSCLENPMDREAWQATVHRVTQSQTPLKCPSTLASQDVFISLTQFPLFKYLSTCCCCLLAKIMGFPRQEYWSGWPFPSPGHLPDSEIKLESLMSPALADRFFTTSTTREDPYKPLGSAISLGLHFPVRPP